SPVGSDDPGGQPAHLRPRPRWTRGHLVPVAGGGAPRRRPDRSDLVPASISLGRYTPRGRRQPDPLSNQTPVAGPPPSLGCDRSGPSGSDPTGPSERVGAVPGRQVAPVQPGH